MEAVRGMKAGLLGNHSFDLQIGHAAQTIITLRFYLVGSHSSTSCMTTYNYTMELGWVSSISVALVIQ